MNQRERNDLDRHITGNYGEDQMKEPRIDVLADVLRDRPPVYDTDYQTVNAAAKDSEGNDGRHTSAVACVVLELLARVARLERQIQQLSSIPGNY